MIFSKGKQTTKSGSRTGELAVSIKLKQGGGWLYHAVISEIHSIVVDTENTGGASNLSNSRARHTREGSIRTYIA